MVLRTMLMPGTRMLWGRQTRLDERPLDINDMQTAVATLQNNAKAPMLARGLRIRATPDGQVRAWYPSSRYISPSYLLGQFVQDEPYGVVLRGTIYESSTTVIIAWVFAALALMMLLVFVALLVTLQCANPGLCICFVGGVLFGLFGYLLLKMRTFTFRVDADRLGHGLRTLLPMGRSHRWA